MDTLSRDEGETETREILWRAIENLPLEQREIITLHYFGGFKYKEIAKSLQIPIGTVMSSLYYARKKLKAELSGVLGFRSSGEV
jgi:RNA polymerase sigma-70 factor (ECF subfamily)